MKITRKGWLSISLGILGMAVVVLLAGVAWVGFQIGAENIPADMARPTESDLAEAKRKLAILEQPITRQEGYVDFNEGELNSLLHELFFAKKNRKDEKLPEPSIKSTNVWQLKRTRVKLNENSIDCYTWASRTIMGRELELCWIRSVALGASSNQWQIVLQSIRVGGMEIPFKRWPLIFSTLGKADEPMIERFEWLRRQPWVELHVDKDKPIPIVRLYNYAPKPETPVKQ